MRSVSYRIAVDEATEQASDCKGGFDFVVGRTGDLDACLRASWSDGPIAVWFLTVDALETFIRAWEQQRPLADIWRIWRVQHDGTGELVIKHDGDADRAVAFLTERGYL